MSDQFKFHLIRVGDHSGYRWPGYAKPVTAIKKHPDLFYALLEDMLTEAFRLYHRGDKVPEWFSALIVDRPKEEQLSGDPVTYYQLELF